MQEQNTLSSILAVLIPYYIIIPYHTLMPILRMADSQHSSARFQSITLNATTNPPISALNPTFSPLAAEGLLVVGAGGALEVPLGVELGLAPLGELLSSSSNTLIAKPVITFPSTSLTS
jgi:hypothetical protein